MAWLASQTRIVSDSRSEVTFIRTTGVPAVFNRADA